MDRPRIARWIRIGFSVVCGIICLLLIVLWVRSYYRLETAHAWPGHTISTLNGRLLVDARFNLVESSGEYFVLRFVAGTSISLRGGAANLKPLGPGIPMWLLTLGAATLAAVPWMGWSTRFSLRTLLIATTLLAILLGTIVHAVR
jgi:hypothetical protein